MSLIIQSLSYLHPDRVLLFTRICFSVQKGQKVALVGNNGSGKSTLLRLIAGELQPTEGEIVSAEKPYYVPQHTGQYDHLTLAQALGVDRKLDALHAILKGDPSPENYTLLEDDWEIEERIRSAFSFWGIEHLSANQPMQQISGGEKSKLFLAGLLIHSPQIILLDEPSNHLDAASRRLLYRFIQSSKSTILCVSHDRALLNTLNTTLELSENSVETFGGNYDFYRKEKEEQLQALQKSLSEKEKNIKQARQKAKEVAEKRQRHEAKGKASVTKKALPRIIANSLQSKAEESSAKSEEVQNERIRGLQESLREVKEQIQRQTILQIDLRTSTLHKGKLLVAAKAINFSYQPEQEALWKSPLTFSIRSGERWCIEGNNGTGKTTLIKLLTGSLSPTSGELFIAGFNTLYIDQEYSVIDNSLSLIEQIQRFNDRNLPDHELKMFLHVHQFPKDTWEKKCSLLSGGEKMKLILCYTAIKENTPDVIILDEPTNNLDIHSQEILTKSIQGFNGTVIVISHDEYFKKEINMEKSVHLE